MEEFFQHHRCPAWSDQTNGAAIGVGVFTGAEGSGRPGVGYPGIAKYVAQGTGVRVLVAPVRGACVRVGNVVAGILVRMPAGVGGDVAEGNEVSLTGGRLAMASCSAVVGDKAVQAARRVAQRSKAVRILLFMRAIHFICHRCTQINTDGGGKTDKKSAFILFICVHLC